MEEHVPSPLEPEVEAAGSNARRLRYPTPAPEFELSMVELDANGLFRDRGPHILLGLEGDMTLSSGGEEVPFTQGSQIFCGADAAYSVMGRGRFALSTTPLQPKEPDR